MAKNFSKVMNVAVMNAFSEVVTFEFSSSNVYRLIAVELGKETLSTEEKIEVDKAVERRLSKEFTYKNVEWQQSSVQIPHYETKTVHLRDILNYKNGRLERIAG